MAYKTTLVTNGRAKAIVVATGMKTEVGKIAGMLQQEVVATPLQKRMADFGKKLSYIILLICLLLFVTGLLRNEDPMKMLLLSISLAVAAIPEALPALITIALARGARRLVKKNALVRKLPAVETLGSVSFICSDKTGTLTQNKMQVQQVYYRGKMFDIGSNKTPLFNDGQRIFIISALNNTITQKPGGELIGDSTELALYHLAEKYDHHKIQLLNQFPLLHLLSFDASRKCMTTVHAYNHLFIGAFGAIRWVFFTVLKTCSSAIYRTQSGSRVDQSNPRFRELSTAVPPARSSRNTAKCR
jgi:Ca2+-transporting ATPase